MERSPDIFVEAHAFLPPRLHESDQQIHGARAHRPTRPAPWQRAAGRASFWVTDSARRSTSRLRSCGAGVPRGLQARLAVLQARSCACTERELEPDALEAVAPHAHRATPARPLSGGRRMRMCARFIALSGARVSQPRARRSGTMPRPRSLPLTPTADSVAMFEERQSGRPSPIAAHCHC
jgi:hypothetical protein